MTVSKTITAAGAFACSMLATGTAWAHTSLAPHAHPHGTSMLLGDESALLAMVVAAVIVGGLALAVGRSRSGAVRADRRRS